MAIVKMKAVTLAAPIEDFNSVAEKYIYGRDIHLENAISVISNKGKLTSFDEVDEYGPILKSLESIIKLANFKINTDIFADENETPETMQKVINKINEFINSERKQIEDIEAKINTNDKISEQFDFMLDANVELSKLAELEFIKCKFGRMPKTGYKTLVTYLDKLEAFFVPTSENDKDIWGFYFVPLLKECEVEEIFNSLYFEAVEIPKGFNGTPLQIYNRLRAERKELLNEKNKISETLKNILQDNITQLTGIYNLAKKRQHLGEIKKYALHGDMFFYIVGWLDEKSAKSLEKEIAAAGDTVMFYMEDASSVKDISPPTKLRNNHIFKPFEMFVKMYGLPNYTEIDPTPLLAITYILFFGIMFGDIGQGFILTLVGFIVYKLKKWDLGGIVGTVGLSAMFFGLIYGSFFGNEEIIPKLLHTTPLHPMKEIALMLGGTIAMGVLIIILGMILNVINAIRDKSFGDAFFGHNGIAGIVFYASVLLLAVKLFLNLTLPTTLFAISIAVSLLCMYFCSPLSKLISGNTNWLPKNAMFFVESLFELFEVVLSFFTNTISFLRIGAFAIVHVGMMMVVAILSQNGGIGGTIVQIIGNIIVMILEGLIVGIQVLRLEYYEMFSRYFSGRGKNFVSLKDK